jgi:hypothetical protein
MKTRTGFVANSSSSSFIIALPKAPENVLDLHTMLFPGGIESLPHPYKDDEVYSSIQVAEQVWSDIQIQKTATAEQVQEEFQYGYSDGQPEMDWDKYQRIKNEKAQQAFRDKYTDAVEAHHAKMAEQLLKEYERKALFIVEYTDDEDRFQCFMEHGDVFRNIPHTRISKH